MPVWAILEGNMKRVTIATFLLMGLCLNIFYLMGVVFTTLGQEQMKLDAGASAEVAATFSIPTMYLIFAAITVLMQIVLFLSFANTMRFEVSTLWIEYLSIFFYAGGRVFYHYIPSLEEKFALMRGTVGYESKILLNQIIENMDFMLALSSSFFLVGVGMTICFKKMTRYWMK